MNSRSARVLFLLVVPGHLVFLYTISSMQGGHTTLTLIFIVFYMTAALLQVSWNPSGGWAGSGDTAVTCTGVLLSTGAVETQQKNPCPCLRDSRAGHRDPRKNWDRRAQELWLM